MVSKNLCVLVHWAKETLALEGLTTTVIIVNQSLCMHMDNPFVIKTFCQSLEFCTILYNLLCLRYEHKQ